MRFCTALCSILVFIAADATVAHAQTQYWDIDTLNVAGAGSATPSGTWSSSASDWNINSTGTGLPTTWIAGNTAVFAAGTNATGAYTVTVSGTQSLAGLTVEEGTVSQNGGTLAFGSTASAPINVASGSAWNQNSTSVITGTGGIVKSGAGTLTLRGTNTFTRSGSGNEAFLTINAGVVDFTADANLGAIPSATDNGAALSFNGGTLRYSGAATFALATNRGVNIGANGGTIEVVNADILALAAGAPAAAALTGSGTLTKTGLGRFRLQTAQTTFTGKYIVKGGSLTFPSQDRLGAIPASTQADYFTLDGGGLFGDLSTGATLDAKRGITLGPGGGYLAFFDTGLTPYDGIISGSQGGGLRLTTNDPLGTSSTGSISLNSANTYNGPTQIDPGMTLSVGILANGGTNSGIGSSSNAAANLILNGGTLLYRGAATSTDRNFTVTISGGYIDASGISNAPLNFTSTAPIGLTGAVPHILVLRGTSTGDNTMSPAIVDLASYPTTLDKIDAGTWILTNTANSYTGNTVISTGGRLKLGASGVIPDASLVQIFSASFFDLNGFDETVRSVSGSSGTIALGAKSLTLNNPNGESYTAAITGTGGGRIIKNGTGKLTLSPATATYDGGVTLNAGVLGIGTNTALGTGPLLVNNSPTLAAASSTAVSPTNAVTLGGNLKFDDSFTASPGSITWGASGANQWTIAGGERTITVNTAAGGYSVTINQPIGQDAAGRGLVKAGNGKLTLTAANTYTGNTTVLAGTLSLGKTSLADSANVFLTTGSTLNLTFAAGTPDVINALSIDGVFQSTGTWGAIGSSAAHQTALITGTGLLQVTQLILPLAGDFNNDGKVDAADYLTWRKANGTSNPLPNDNGLGTPIGQAHLSLWRQHFGNTPGAGSGNGLGGNAAPEPASLLLLCLGIAALPATRAVCDRRCPRSH
jgi:fibronectin-binding autotransporter adhesin